VKTESIFGYYT